MSEKERRALRPDGQAFDEVRIVTVPRYKTSGLSGDEWRISASIRFFRKGKLVHETSYCDVKTACIFAAADYLRGVDDGKGCFAGEGDTCDQEGCSRTATVTLRIRKEFCREGHGTDPYARDPKPLVRRFCEEHAHRGDASFEDADRNYEKC